MIKIGEVLTQERKKKGLSIEEVAKATKIRPPFIAAIENGDYGKLPSSTYATGFVKNYIAFLGLPHQRDLMAVFRREFDEKEHLGVLPESFVNREDIPISGRRWQRNVFLIFIVALLLIFFIGFQYRSAIFGPPLSVSVPKDNSVISSQQIVVTGNTDSDATVSVNGLPAFVDNNGNFTKALAVFPGKSVITILSTNSYTRTTTVQRHITVK